MSGVVFTPRAKLHLLAIWDYSVEQWGERRTDDYLREINTTILNAANGRRILRPCDQYGAGMKSLRSGSHTIYLRYDAEADAFLVLGVLHQHLEPSRHLKED